MAESDSLNEKVASSQEELMALKDKITMMGHQLDDYQAALKEYEGQEVKGMTDIQNAIFQMFQAFVKGSS
tara:strand:- start:838 stop:1047 length:210 start_codon:yes stop_codon:yes gene_type:complete